MSAVALAGCSDPSDGAATSSNTAAAAPQSSAPPTPPIPPPPPAAPPMATPAPQAEPEAPSDPAAVAINTAGAQTAADADGANPALIRAQVLLDRARFSPGVIDGRPGGNLRNAVAAYERTHDLPVDGKLDDQVWRALTTADGAPAITSYVITSDDVQGPFGPAVSPGDYAAMARLDRLAFTSPLEALAEKFHMDEPLLKALNPGADFGTAGTRILVAAVSPGRLGQAVTAIEVDKSARQVRAFGPDGRLLAAYPASVGSTERPAPNGEFAVKGVATDPVYTYDPKRLTFGDRSQGKLVIKPGPNNPVGVAWIDLTAPTYGLHGAPDPRLVGKVASHGCVRLTNWDVRELAAAVKQGAKVKFVGRDGARSASG